MTNKMVCPRNLCYIYLCRETCSIGTAIDWFIHKWNTQQENVKKIFARYGTKIQE